MDMWWRLCPYGKCLCSTSRRKMQSCLFRWQACRLSFQHADLYSTCACRAIWLGILNIKKRISIQDTLCYKKVSFQPNFQRWFQKFKIFLRRWALRPEMNRKLIVLNVAESWNCTHSIPREILGGYANFRHSARFG